MGHSISVQQIEMGHGLRFVQDFNMMISITKLLCIQKIRPQLGFVLVLWHPKDSTQNHRELHASKNDIFVAPQNLSTL